MEAIKTLDRIKLRTSSISVYVIAVRAGIGIGLLPAFYRHYYPDLIEMPMQLADRGELWVVSHEETNSVRRTRMLLDFLNTDFRKNGRNLFG